MDCWWIRKKYIWIDNVLYLAIPFFTYTLLSTLLYSFLIEVINSIYSFDKIKN